MENPIKPNTKIRILSEEHGEYVQKLAFEAGFSFFPAGFQSVRLGLAALFFHDDNEITFLSKQLSDFKMIYYADKEHKEIFIDLPQPSIESRVLAEKVGTKYDQGKPAYNLIPVHAEAEFVDVLTFGSGKYGAENWRKVETLTERYTAAAMRHLAAYRMGETHDSESGKHHLAHAMCCLAFIIENDLSEDA